MKLKNMLSTFIVFVLAMGVFSQSAFAMTGVGDTKENAISLFPEMISSGWGVGQQDVNMYIDSASDQDWFKWTNITGKDLVLRAAIQPKDENSYLRIGMIIQYPSGKQTSIFYADPSNGPEKAKTLDGFQLPPGATVYISIDASTFGTSSQYWFLFRLFQF
ncbi:hypothetical protein [Paenibacillus sp. B1-33]|uniref:hypothetical protein n=1 Tax=unclassified Paenibacillus TaxID=185978 RepID=UPI003D2B6927